MSSQIAAKSILTQPKANSAPTISDEQKAKAAQDRRNLGIALYHANKIQSQKDVSARILAVIETLIEFPAGSTFTVEEAQQFTDLIEIFQPSDLDDLVEERRAEGKCGYVLCAESPRSITFGASAAWKLKSKAAGDYCSNACMRKSLYVRTQLSETPAWEREPGQQARVVLDEHVVESGNDASAKKQVEAERRVANGQELALERGETTQSFKPRQVMKDVIVEKASTAQSVASLPAATQGSHSRIEGYEPKGINKKPKTQGSDDEDEPVDDEVPPNIDSQYAPQRTEEDIDVEDSWRELYENIDNPQGPG